MAQTIFERYGGFAKVSRVVSAFYDKALESPLLAPYFTAIDMRRLIDHQTKFVAFLMGGPASYTNDHLAHVHARLGINRADFEVMVETMAATLSEFDVSPADVSGVVQELRTRAPWIISAANSEGEPASR